MHCVKQAGISGLKGHRSVGGVPRLDLQRASHEKHVETLGGLHAGFRK